MTRQGRNTARLYRTWRGCEVALNRYWGFWKCPSGSDPLTGLAIFSRLAVGGASLRGKVRRGIGNVEFAFSDSLDDRQGSDPFIRNSELRSLAGYEQELARDLTLAIQYNVEYMLEDDDYRRSLPAGTPEADEDRHLLTLRITRPLWSQTLVLGEQAPTFFNQFEKNTNVYLGLRYSFDDPRR